MLLFARRKSNKTRQQLHRNANKAQQQLHRNANKASAVMCHEHKCLTATPFRGTVHIFQHIFLLKYVLYSLLKYVLYSLLKYVLYSLLKCILHSLLKCILHTAQSTEICTA